MGPETADGAHEKEEGDNEVGLFGDGSKLHLCKTEPWTNPQSRFTHQKLSRSQAVSSKGSAWTSEDQGPRDQDQANGAGLL
jgi:hypothetical protein